MYVNGGVDESGHSCCRCGRVQTFAVQATMTQPAAPAKLRCQWSWSYTMYRLQGFEPVSQSGGKKCLRTSPLVEETLHEAEMQMKVE